MENEVTLLQSLASLFACVHARAHARDPQAQCRSVGQSQSEPAPPAIRHVRCDEKKRHRDRLPAIVSRTCTCDAGARARVGARPSACASARKCGRTGAGSLGAFGC